MIINRRAVLAASVAVLALAVPMVLGAAPVPGKIAKQKFSFGDRQITYYLYVPKSIAPGASAPMIVLLHGSGRDGSSLVEPWKGLAEKEGVILVGPDSADTRQWKVPTDGPEPLCVLVEELRASLPVDRRRVYLFGHSGGAVFAIYMAVLEPEFFAAMAIHAGALRTSDEFRSLGAMPGKIPMFITVGDRDPYFPVAAVNETASAFKARGIDVRVDVIANHDHNYYGMSAKVNKTAWEFLKPHALDADPNYVAHVIR